MSETCLYPQTFETEDGKILLVFCERDEGHDGVHTADLADAIPDLEEFV